MIANNEASLTGAAEAEVMRQRGAALWEAMTGIVEAAPHYQGVTEPERSACIARLALQALMCAVLDGAPQGSGSYVVVSSVGRLVGQLVAQTNGVDAQNLLNFLSAEIAVGARDYEAMMRPRGRA